MEELAPMTTPEPPDPTTQVRRLPVYLMVDCSGSMAGEPIVAMEAGIRGLVSELKDDPQALETVWLSVITFGSTAEQVVPLTDIEDFQTPHLDARGSTALGEAMGIILECLRDEVHPQTQDVKGDWRPVVYLFTDGEPTDDWELPTKEFRDSGIASLVVCGAGPEVDEATLKRIGDYVVRLADTQPGTLGSFVKWVSMSVTATSRSLGAKAKDGPELPQPPEGVVILP